MKLANIVYNCELVNHDECEYCNYINTDKLIIDYDINLPTLYVGWGLLKICNPSVNLSILKHEIVKDWVYWTFDFNEKNDLHINDIENFVRKITYNYFINGVYNYNIIDYIQYLTTDDLISSLPKNIDNVYIYKNSMLYIKDDLNIYGIDLDGCRFFNLDVDIIINYCNKISPTILNDVNGDKYVELCEIYGSLEYLKRFVVCLI